MLIDCENVDIQAICTCGAQNAVEGFGVKRET